jgi:hypothetical protein
MSWTDFIQMMYICEVYFLEVKMKIFTSLNIYLESESLIGNIQHLNLNSRKMLFCMTKVELSVTSTVLLFYFHYWEKGIMLLPQTYNDANLFIHTFLDRWLQATYTRTQKLHILCLKQTYTYGLWEPGELSWYGDSLHAGRSRDPIPVGGEIFNTCPDWAWGPPTFLYNGYRVFPGGKAARAWRWPPTPI